ncbi:Sugar transport protein [Quillaja saponaria]|nr:Sugar transport protein [Quillaja saponaria]
MAPPKWRGALNSGFQLFLGLGSVVANVINFAVDQLGDSGWRISLGSAAVPAIIMTVGSIFIPDTPSSLIQRDKIQKARQSLTQVRGNESDIESKLNELISHNEARKAANSQPFKTIVERQYRPQLILTIAIPAFQQLTGINIISFYAPVLFRSIGFGLDGSLVASVILGVLNLAAALVPTFFVDRLGRRILFIEAGIQIFMSEVAMAMIFAVELGTKGTAQLSKGSAIAILVLLASLGCAFGWSWGPLTWLVPGEILPMEVRPAGQGICTSMNLLITFFISQTLLRMLCTMKYGLFLFFASWVIVMTEFVALFLPETKGRHLESMDEVWQNHWFWHWYAKKPVMMQELDSVEGRC